MTDANKIESLKDILETILAEHNFNGEVSPETIKKAEDLLKRV